MLRDGRGLYLIITRPAIPHVELVAAAVDLGVPVVQLREKEASEDELTELASRLAAVARGSRTLFVVNDRPRVALRSGADGVHVGREDASTESARLTLGDDLVVGVSGNTPEEADEALAAGADYLGVGPIFPTSTKPDARSPIGLEGLRRVVEARRELPTVAVGGIDLERAPSVITAGARYVAVVSAVCHAPDPLRALRTLNAALTEL
jgi:thiamine-phosphate pyrophosphorylase